MKRINTSFIICLGISVIIKTINTHNIQPILWLMNTLGMTIQ